MNDPDLMNPSGGTDPAVGGGIVALTLAGTALFVLAGVLAAIFMGTFMVAYVAISLLEFAFGMLVFALAFLRAVDRSRSETIGVGGLFFGAGSAPRQVRIRLIGSLVVQTVASIAIASTHLYTALAFGVVAPMWSLGLTGLWVAAYGSFPPREFDPRLDRGSERRAKGPGPTNPTE
jgi:hypothetical protein